MSYFVIKVPSDKRNAYCVDSPGPLKDDLRAWDFRMGKEISFQVPLLSVKTDKDHGSKFLDVIPTQGLEFIVSLKLMETFKSLKLNNLQFFPLTVTDYKSKKKFNFWLCNIIGLIPCLDKNKADIVWNKTKDDIFMLKKIAIDETVIEKFNETKKHEDKLRIFRLKEKEEYIIVHSEIHYACINAGILGIEFRKPEDAGDFL
jgi:hypothetical protein